MDQLCNNIDGYRVMDRYECRAYGSLWSKTGFFVFSGANDGKGCVTDIGTVGTSTAIAWNTNTDATQSSGWPTVCFSNNLFLFFMWKNFEFWVLNLYEVFKENQRYHILLFNRDEKFEI